VLVHFLLSHRRPAKRQWQGGIRLIGHRHRRRRRALCKKQPARCGLRRWWIVSRCGLPPAAGAQPGLGDLSVVAGVARPVRSQCRAWSGGLVRTQLRPAQAPCPSEPPARATAGAFAFGLWNVCSPAGMQFSLRQRSATVPAQAEHLRTNTAARFRAGPAAPQDCQTHATAHPAAARIKTP